MSEQALGRLGVRMPAKGPLCCPQCGAGLELELLEVKLGEREERLFSLSCPGGDYRATATEARVNRAIAEAMFEHLKCAPFNRPTLAT